MIAAVGLAIFGSIACLCLTLRQFAHECGISATELAAPRGPLSRLPPTTASTPPLTGQPAPSMCGFPASP